MNALIDGGAYSYWAIVPCNEAQAPLPSTMWLFTRRDEAEAIIRSLQVQDPTRCWTLQRRALHFQVSVFAGSPQEPD